MFVQTFEKVALLIVLHCVQHNAHFIKQTQFAIVQLTDIVLLVCHQVGNNVRVTLVFSGFQIHQLTH